MSIERTGKINPVTPRIKQFLTERMRGVSLDHDGDIEARPDFDCLSGRLIIEIKSLETSPKIRIDNVLDEVKQSEDWPKFYGSWPMDSILKHLPHKEKVNRELTQRVGRAIVNHLNKANNQLNNYCSQNKGDESVRMVFLINEDFTEYTPELVQYIVGKELSRNSNKTKKLKYSSVDFVVFISERHAMKMDGQVTLPLILIVNNTVDEKPWKNEIAELTLKRWAKWNNRPLKATQSPKAEDFKEFFHIPNSMKRSEKWTLDYKRNPYMQSWSDYDVIDFWHLVKTLSLIAFHIKPPFIMPEEGVKDLMEKISHLMVENSNRGISLEQMKPNKETVKRAIEKVTYGKNVQAWLTKQLEHIK